MGLGAFCIVSPYFHKECRDAQLPLITLACSKLNRMRLGVRVDDSSIHPRSRIAMRRLPSFAFGFSALQAWRPARRTAASQSMYTMGCFSSFSASGAVSGTCTGTTTVCIMGTSCTCGKRTEERVKGRPGENAGIGSGRRRASIVRRSKETPHAAQTA